MNGLIACVLNLARSYEELNNHSDAALRFEQFLQAYQHPLIGHVKKKHPLKRFGKSKLISMQALMKHGVYARISHLTFTKKTTNYLSSFPNWISTIFFYAPRKKVHNAR